MDDQQAAGKVSVPVIHRAADKVDLEMEESENCLLKWPVTVTNRPSNSPALRP